MKLISATAATILIASAVEASVPAPTKPLPPLVDKLSQHGCYCSQVFGDRTTKYRDAGEPADLFDKACFELMSCMQCEAGEEEECDLLDRDMMVPNMMLYDGTRPAARDICEKHFAKNRCGKASCVCMQEFAGYMSGKQILQSKNKQKKEVFEEKKDAKCNKGMMPPKIRCDLPEEEEEETEVIVDPVEPEDPVKPEPETCERPVKPIPEAYMVLHPTDRCIGLDAEKENVPVKTIENNNKVSKEDWNSAQSLFKPKPEKECDSTAALALNQAGNIVIIASKEKCLQLRKPSELGNKKDIRVSITRECENQPTWSLSPIGQLVPDAADNYCLTYFKNSKKYGGELILQQKNSKGSNCMIFKGVKTLSEIKEIEEEVSILPMPEDDKPVDYKALCYKRCEKAGRSDIKCVRLCVEELQDLSNDYCHDRCDGNKCCMKECEAAEKPDVLKPVKPEKPTKPTDDNVSILPVEPEKPSVDDLVDKCEHCFDKEQLQDCRGDYKVCQKACLHRCLAAQNSDEEKPGKPEKPATDEEKPEKPTKPAVDDEEEKPSKPEKPTKPADDDSANNVSGQVVNMINDIASVINDYPNMTRWQQKKAAAKLDAMLENLMAADKKELAEAGEKFANNPQALGFLEAVMNGSGKEYLQRWMESAAEKPNEPEEDNTRPVKPADDDKEDSTLPEKPTKPADEDKEDSTRPEKPSKPAEDDKEDSTRPEKPSKPIEEDKEDQEKEEDKRPAGDANDSVGTKPMNKPGKQ
jgi:hypothetical protein